MPSYSADKVEPSTGSNSVSNSSVFQHQGVVWALAFLGLAGMVLLGMTLATNLGQPDPSSQYGEGVLTQEMLRIGDELQCPICEGQSVAFSNSRLAEEMRLQIMEQLAAGADEATIKRYFVDRYGEVVLREPSRTGLNLWLWWMPVIGLVVGLFVLLWTLRQTNRNHKLNQTASDSTTAKKSDDLDPEIEAIISQYDRELLES